MKMSTRFCFEEYNEDIFSAFMIQVDIFQIFYICQDGEAKVLSRLADLWQSSITISSLQGSQYIFRVWRHYKKEAIIECSCPSPVFFEPDPAALLLVILVLHIEIISYINYCPCDWNYDVITVIEAIRQL